MKVVCLEMTAKNSISVAVAGNFYSHWLKFIGVDKESMT